MVSARCAILITLFVGSLSIEDVERDMDDMLFLLQKKINVRMLKNDQYERLQKTGCPSNNVDVTQHADQCYQHPARNGWLKSYGPSSNALCINENQCKLACSATASCVAVEMHRSLDRCYLNTGACVATAAQNSNKDYDLLIPVAPPLRTRYDNMCMDYNFDNKNVYMHKCHTGRNQKWYMDHERLSTQHDDKCLDLNYKNGNVYMHNCHGGSNQQWFFDGESLRSRHSPTKCLDYNFNNGNIYLGSCHGGNNQKFYWALPPNPALATRIKSRHGEKCLDYNFVNANLYFHTCHDGLNQKFYLDGVQLKSLYDNKCADYNYNNKNVYMHDCHNGENQQWYLDGEQQFKTNYDANCLDLHTANGNVYMYGCHGGDNQKFYMENVVEGLDHNEVEDEIRAEEEEVRECEDWCYSKKHLDTAWEGKKCAWKSCAGCSEC